MSNLTTYRKNIGEYDLLFNQIGTIWNVVVTDLAGNIFTGRLGPNLTPNDINKLEEMSFISSLIH